MRAGSPIMPHVNDVLLGRGGNNNKHVGNAQLRKLARARVRVYSEASKKDKSRISRDLVIHVRNMSPPGRFLKRNAFNEDWEDVGDDIAREKASQALRDAVSKKDTGDDDFDQEELVMPSAPNNREQEKSVPCAPSGPRRMKHPALNMHAPSSNDEIHGGMNNMNPPTTSSMANTFAHINLTRHNHNSLQAQMEMNMNANMMQASVGSMGPSSLSHQGLMSMGYSTGNDADMTMGSTPQLNNINTMNAPVATETVPSSSQKSYKYYGNIRNSIAKASTSNVRTKREVNNGRSGGLALGGLPSIYNNHNKASLPGLSGDNSSMENFSSESNVANAGWHQPPTSSLPSLYQHIQDRTRIRSKRTPHMNNNVHFNDRSSIGRSSIGKSSIGKSSMGGIETISNLSSNMASERNLDLSNFEWLPQSQTSQGPAGDRGNQGAVGDANWNRSEMSWASCD